MYDLNVIFLLCLGIFFTAVLFIFVVVIFLSKPYPIVKRSRKEQCFIDPVTNQSVEFPSIKEPSTLHLSLIIPAYNEEKRC